MSFKCSCQARVHVPVQVSNAGLMDYTTPQPQLQVQLQLHLHYTNYTTLDYNCITQQLQPHYTTLHPAAVLR
jgi:hypothetical protein